MPPAHDTDRPVEQQPLLGMGLRLLTALLLAIMFAGVKMASQRGVNVIESLFYRQIGTATCATLWVAFGPGFASLRTKRVKAHVGRMALGLTAMGLNFLSFALLPLAEATAIGFSVPIFSVILAAMLLHEPTGKWRWGAVLVGFIGVLVIVQPGENHLPLNGIAVAIVAAGMTAAVTIVIRRLGATEAAPTTVFWFAVSSLVPMALLMPFVGQAHDPATWTIIFVLSLAGGLAQLTLTAALRFAPVALVMPMDYTSLIWASLLGVLLFQQMPSHWTWIGAPIVIGSGLVILRREHRMRKRSVG
nr:DMT family transporter [uncultured Sphingomonas sp.]